MTIKYLWKPLKWNSNDFANSPLTFEEEKSVNHMNIPSERHLKEPEVGKTLKRWERPDPVRHLTRTAAERKSDESNAKINFLCSYKWLYLKDCVFEWVRWRGYVGSRGCARVKEIKKCRAFNSSLCLNSPGILLDLMKAPKVSKSLK